MAALCLQRSLAFQKLLADMEKTSPLSQFSFPRNSGLFRGSNSFNRREQRSNEFLFPRCLAMRFPASPFEDDLIVMVGPCGIETPQFNIEEHSSPTQDRIAANVAFSLPAGHDQDVGTFLCREQNFSLGESALFANGTRPVLLNG